MADPLREFLLAFADDEHLMGQQHTEWIGVAPFLEEDLAESSIGQDELGHAVLLYELVLDLDDTEPSDANIDALAYGRSGEQYRSSDLAEYVTTDWAEALVRHWLYDEAEHLRWANVTACSHAPLADIVDRVLREEAFHRLHANAMLDALLDDADARALLVAALDRVAPMAPGVLANVNGEAELLATGVVAAPTESLLRELSQQTSERFDVEILLEPAGPDHRYRRSEAFTPLMKRMREVLDYDPSASW